MESHQPPPFVQPDQSLQPTQETYNYAAQLLVTQKRSAQDVKNVLLQQGYSQESANTVVDALVKTMADNGKKKASSDMKIGAAVCIIGIIVTVVTYDMVKNKGGTYFVAYGAIIFGAIQFLRGLFNSMKYK